MLSQTHVLAQWLKEGGRLASAWPHYQPRAAQQAMASCVERALAQQQSCALEMPTGAGKTLAYLLPLILSGRAAVVAQPTHQLQQQVLEQALPPLLALLEVNYRVFSLVGRWHYFCPQRAEQGLQQPLSADLHHLLIQALQQWQRRDRLALTVDQCLPSPVSVADQRRWLHSDRQHCQEHHCPHVARCPYRQARELAEQADLVIVNHALLRQGLRGELPEWLARREAVVVDEAHQWLMAQGEALDEGINPYQWRQALRESRHALQPFTDLRALHTLLDRGERLLDWLEQHLPTREGLSLRPLLQWAQQWAEALAVQQGRSFALDRQQHYWLQMVAWLAEQEGEHQLWGSAQQWYLLPSEPRHVGSQRLPVSWCYVSATLTIADRWEFPAHQFGLSLADCHRWSPSLSADWQLHTPSDAPLPDSPEASPYLAALLQRLQQQRPGRWLLLCTSQRALQRLREHWPVTDIPSWWQGEAPVAQQQRQFLASPSGILAGLRTWWEGIDLPPGTLQGVVIDRLPFTPPDHPSLRWQASHYRSRDELFEQWQLPLAVMRFRQGAGRLLRPGQEGGVLVVADPRIWQRGYGALFRHSVAALDWHTTPLNELVLDAAGEADEATAEY